MKQKAQHYFLYLVLFTYLGCSDGYKNIAPYYFPLEELYDGLAYEYRSTINDSIAPYYWYFRTLDQDGTTYLTSMYYDYSFTPIQFVREEKVNNGMLLEQLFIYETDTTDLQVQIPVQIAENQNNTFPFEVKDSLGVFLYNVSFTSPIDTSQINIIRNRRYLKDTTYTYYGKKLPAVLFDIKEAIQVDKEGILELKYNGKEIYAKGLGLVYVSKYAESGNFQQIYALHDRYPMTELERKFGKK